MHVYGVSFLIFPSFTEIQLKVHFSDFNILICEAKKGQSKNIYVFKVFYVCVSFRKRFMILILQAVQLRMLDKISGGINLTELKYKTSKLTVGVKWKKKINQLKKKRGGQERRKKTKKIYQGYRGSNVHASNLKKASKYINQSDDREQMTRLSAQEISTPLSHTDR